MRKWKLLTHIIIVTGFSLFYGCAGKSVLSPKTVSSQTASVQNDIDDVELEFDTLPAESAKVDIDELLNKARVACTEQQFENADTLLRKALRLIEIQDEMTESEWFPAEEYLNDVISIYSELMPTTIQAPDDIALRLFQLQISRSLDSLKTWPIDSSVLAKLACQKGVAYDVPIVWNNRVQRALHFYTNNSKMNFNRLLQRAGYFLPIMKKMFADSGLPQDLAYLPLIESGFSTVAYSHARASGIWQFIETTGVRYGLRHNYWIDERRDPVKATTAAILYLRKLYGDFNNWHLALAAYNCGEGGLGRAINRCNTNDYWQLTLPSETMNYVPLYIAALTIAKNPECFGYSAQATDTLDLDTVYINDCVDLKSIATGIGISVDSIKRYNPQILHWCTPPDMKDVLLYLPKGTADTFKTFYSTLSDDQKVKWYRYKIRRGDNITSIAQAFKVPTDDIRSVNRLTGKRLVPGRYLLVPLAANANTPPALAEPSFRDTESDNSTSKRKSVPVNSSARVRYKVRAGDTIWRIATKYDVDPEDLRRWNGMSRSDRLLAGKVMVLYPQRETSVKTTSEEAITSSSEKPTHYGKYQVSTGDTPYSIARKLGITIDQLIAWNHLSSSRPVIHAGETLVYGEAQSARITSSENRADVVKYKVNSGDNLYRICQNFSVSISEVMNLNNMNEKSLVKVGDILLIPEQQKRTGSGKNKSGQTLYYKVKAGDNLWSIAQEFGVSIKQLYRANGLNRDSVLTPGDIIKVVNAGEM